MKIQPKPTAPPRPRPTPTSIGARADLVIRWDTPLTPANRAIIAMIAPAMCQCGDPRCGCDCIPGDYPCEHSEFLGGGCGR